VFVSTINGLPASPCNAEFPSFCLRSKTPHADFVSGQQQAGEQLEQSGTRSDAYELRVKARQKFRNISEM